MRITKDVTIGAQVGVMEYDSNSDVTVHLTGLRGSVKLAELEAVLREARDLDRRLNPVAAPQRKKARRG